MGAMSRSTTDRVTWLDTVLPGATQGASTSEHRSVKSEGSTSVGPDRLSCLPLEILHMVVRAHFQGVRVKYKSYESRTSISDSIISLLLVSRKIGPIAKPMLYDHATSCVSYKRQRVFSCPECGCLKPSVHPHHATRNSMDKVSAIPPYDRFRALCIRTRTIADNEHVRTWDVIYDIEKVLYEFCAMTRRPDVKLLTIDAPDLIRWIDLNISSRVAAEMFHYLGSTLCTAAFKSSAQIFLSSRFDMIFDPPEPFPKNTKKMLNASAFAVRMSQQEERPPVPLICDLLAPKEELVNWLAWLASLPKETQSLDVYEEHVKRVRELIGTKNS